MKAHFDATSVLSRSPLPPLLSRERRIRVSRNFLPEQGAGPEVRTLAWQQAGGDLGTDHGGDRAYLSEVDAMLEGARAT